MLNCLSNDTIRKPTLKTFYKAMTDTSEGYASSFTQVCLHHSDFNDKPI